jgi:alkanesulfonate monooxygenase SsuD/methylene tetrahydromethanopterin reductase-like flavin-dependent oxidoreductase (luciferase family)
MRLGVVILPEHRWAEAQRLWRRAEELGFAHAWTYDHLAWRTLRDEPWFATVPTLTAAALATERMRIGPLVASPNFRHPVPFAKELMTLDDISAGRLTVGLGAGGEGWDATMLGGEPLSRGDRARRFAEFVTMLDTLLRAPEMSYRGDFYVADEARGYPGCVQQPRVPFAIAAWGPAAMRAAVQHAQSWVTFGDPTRPEADGVAVVQDQMRRLDDACAAAGRDPITLERMVLTGPEVDPGLDSPEHFRETVAEYEAIGATDFVVHWPRPGDPYRGDVDAFERAITS